MENSLIYGGQIAGFPEQVVLKMQEYQFAQSGKNDIKAFESLKSAVLEKEGFDWNKTVEKHTFWREVILEKNFDIFFQKFNCGWTLNDLKFGRVAMLNDGTLEDLETVLQHVFPKCKSTTTGLYKYYISNSKDIERWCRDDYTDLPKQSVKLFLEQIPIPKVWTLEDLRLGKVALLNDGSLEDLKEVLKTVFPEDTATDSMNGGCKYYFKHPNSIKYPNYWDCADYTDLPTQSLKKFLEQINLYTVVYCKTIEQWNQVLNYIGDPYKLKNKINSFKGCQKACIVISAKTPDGIGKYDDEFRLEKKSKIYSFEEWDKTILNSTNIPSNNMAQTLSRKQLVELYNIHTCSEWRSRIDVYLQKLLRASDNTEIIISEDDIRDVFKKCTAIQIAAVTSMGIKHGINILNYPNGFYELHFSNGETLIIKKVGNQYQHLESDIYHNIAYINPIISIQEMVLVPKK
jgi:hypothetical protein